MNKKEKGHKAFSNFHDYCLMCGEKNPLSLGLQFDDEDDGSVSADFQGNRLLQGYKGILHGGVISALLDTAMAHCLMHRGIEGMTGELNVRFLSPVPCNAPLHIQASVKEELPPLYYLRATISIGGKIVCKAKAKFMSRNP